MTNKLGVSKSPTFRKTIGGPIVEPNTKSL